MDGLKLETNRKVTENGEIVLKSTLNANLDFFSLAGACRRNCKLALDKFISAYAEDPETALRALFYTRNIRGGLGEREVFKTILRYMAVNHPKDMIANFANIARFGRYDDFYAMEGTPLEDEAFAYLREQFITDVAAVGARKEGQTVTISLLGKWLKTMNSHNRETRRLAQRTAEQFGLTERQYRKMVSMLRKAIKIVERNMSANEWDKIKYETVPSYAMKKYSVAFKRHDEDRFKDYINNVKKGEIKINASTLYPYDLIHELMFCRGCDRSTKIPVIEEQWKALPNYVEGSNKFLIMADVSGSMIGRPMETAIGLAIYFAERNKGPYANKFLTFSQTPCLVDVNSSTLEGKMHQVSGAEWGMNTDLAAAFETVLQVAVRNKLKQKDLPESVVVITDMEFDRCVLDGENFHDKMVKRFASKGYKLPKVVFWNVAARQATFHATANTPGVQFISGSSPSAFKSLIEGKTFDAIDLMLETLYTPMYDCVVLGE